MGESEGGDGLHQRQRKVLGFTYMDDIQVPHDALHTKRRRMSRELAYFLTMLMLAVLASI
jgi:hypothetical protein